MKMPLLLLNCALSVILLPIFVVLTLISVVLLLLDYIISVPTEHIRQYSNWIRNKVTGGE